MKKYILSLALAVLSSSAVASWTVTTEYDDMTDMISHHSLQSVSKKGDGVFALTCYANGLDRISIWQPEYIGFTDADYVRIGIDGAIQDVEPIYQKMTHNSHFSSLSYDNDFVDMLVKGLELRIKVVHQYRNSSVFKHDLIGFTAAHKVFVEKCNKFVHF